MYDEVQEIGNLCLEFPIGHTPSLIFTELKILTEKRNGKFWNNL